MFFEPNRCFWLRVISQKNRQNSPKGTPIFVKKVARCVQIPSSLRFSCGLRLRSMRFWLPHASPDFLKLQAFWKLHLLRQDTIVFEQFSWSTVEEQMWHLSSRYHRLWAIHVVYGRGVLTMIPTWSLVVLFGSRLLWGGCRRSTRRSYIHKLPINRPSGRILSSSK